MVMLIFFIVWVRLLVVIRLSAGGVRQGRLSAARVPAAGLPARRLPTAGVSAGGVSAAGIPSALRSAAAAPAAEQRPFLRRRMVMKPEPSLPPYLPSSVLLPFSHLSLVGSGVLVQLGGAG